MSGRGRRGGEAVVRTSEEEEYNENGTKLGWGEK
jgi:hypothetical protein